MAVVAGVIGPVVAVAQTALAPASTAACRHSSTWEPTEQELHRILAWHAGWLQQMHYIDLRAHDRYLDNDKRAHLDWRREARSNRAQAHLCNANLAQANLSGANFMLADLSNAELYNANLAGATLSGAGLSGASLIGANLSRADLRGAYLVGANLRAANLSGADLYGAHLSHVNLLGANLSDANLSGADLRSADLSSANLQRANVNYANLSGAADLTNANLSNSDLTHANLGGADLTGAQVAKAALAYVDLTNAVYAPVSEPPAPYVAGITGLATLRAASGQQFAIVQLRKLLEDGGFRDHEREATYAIERNKTTDLLSSAPWWHFAWIVGVFRLVGFAWTVAYGMSPWQGLIEIVLLGAAFTFVYIFAIPSASTRTATASQTVQSGVIPAPAASVADGADAVPPPTAQKSGIYQVFAADRIDAALAEPVVDKDPKIIRVSGTTWWDVFCKAAYFSLLSAVNIGFEQFTPGDWIRRLQGQDYTLEAVGWVRVVAGAQALLSVYLLAMWALTQFGRPFE
jgi:uncharacterized protein YjbI with pentapeptide repeats